MEKIIYFLFTKSLGLYINLISFLHPKKANELTYEYFSHPREGKLDRERLPQFLHETLTENIQIGNHRFPVYIWQGNETKILLIHGWESNASRWESFLPHLKKSGCTIIAIDAPAHGLATGKEFSIPKYAEFIHKTVEKYNPLYLIGHSIGGKTCLYYKYLYPNDNIEKMVILGAPSDFKILIKNYVNILSLNSRLASNLEKNYMERYKKKLEDFSSRKFVTNLKIKGLIIHDVDDKVVSINEGKKIAEAWKDAKFIETKGLGHSMHDDVLYQNIYTFLFE